MLNKFDIVTIGDIKLDTFINMPNASVSGDIENGTAKLCIDYGKKNQANSIDLQIAGSAPNVAIGLTKMKKSAAILSEMGKDFIHIAALEYLKKNKVDTRYVKAINESDSSFAAVFNYKGESTQVVAHSDHEYNLPAKHPSTKWVHVSELGKGYQKIYKNMLTCCAPNGVKISLNPGAVQIEEKRKELFNLFKKTTVLFLNKVEAEQILELKEEETMHYIMGQLKKLGPDYVVVTDGRNGAFAFDGKRLDYAPMFPGKRVEATGAGDAFTSGFLGAMMHNKSHAEALTWGAVNAASVVFHIGPTAGLLSHTEIKRRLKAKPRYKTQEL